MNRIGVLVMVAVVGLSSPAFAASPKKAQSSVPANTISHQKTFSPTLLHEFSFGSRLGFLSGSSGSSLLESSLDLQSDGILRSRDLSWRAGFLSARGNDLYGVPRIHFAIFQDLIFRRK